MDTDTGLTQSGDEPAQDGDETAETGAEAPQPTADAPKGPQWEERDAWTALDDLDASPTLVPASEWPAGAEGLDRPGLFALWVDETGAAELSRGLELPLEAGRIYVGQAGATKWPSGRANQDTLGDRIARSHLTGQGPQLHRPPHPCGYPLRPARAGRAGIRAAAGLSRAGAQ